MEDENKDNVCHGQFPHGCGQTVNEHKFFLRLALTEILLSIGKRYKVGEPYRVKELMEYHSQEMLKRYGRVKDEYTNHSHLAYWGFIKKHYTEEEDDDEKLRVQGTWELTQTGADFILGAKAKLWYVRFNRKVVLESEEEVTVNEVVGYFDPYEAWVERMKPTTSVPVRQSQQHAWWI